MKSMNSAIIEGAKYESSGAALTARSMVTQRWRSCDMSTIRIPLNSRKYPGLYALIDEADFELVSQYQWHPKPQSRGIVYAATGKSSVRMHRIIMSPDEFQVVDHINGNGLDNRRENLRVCSVRQNTRNLRGVKSNNASGYNGVAWHRASSKWRAEIVDGHRKIWLGVFDSPIEAAIVRDMAAIDLHGEFASLNFPVLRRFKNG